MKNSGPMAMTFAEIEESIGTAPRYCAFASVRRDGSPFVIRVPVSPDNVATGDLTKVALPIAAGAVRPGW